jgi:hypothetical protein
VTASRIALLALVLMAGASLSTAAGQPSSDSTSTAPAADNWVITGHETCSGDRLVVGRNIIVLAGGVLDLDGCVLAMDSPPYNDTYFSQKAQGLGLRVEAGGLLRLHAEPGRPAGIERQNSSYGYTVTAFGDFESVGLPGTPNRITGLEGAHEGQLAFSGLQVHGNATVRHTQFEGNFGPSLFAVGARVQGDHIDFLGWGGLVAIQATVALSNFTAHALNTPIAISLSEVAFSDCRIDGGRTGMTVAMTNLTMRRCSVASNGTALAATDANVTLSSVDVSYGAFGLTQLHKSKNPQAAAYDNLLFLEGSSVLGSGPNATSAIQANQGAVEVRNGHLSSARNAVINASLVNLTVSGSRLEGPSAIRVTDPYSVDVQGTTGPSPLVAVWRNTVVQVKDPAGAGVQGVELGLRGVQAVTDKNGRAVLHWHLLDAERVTSLDYGEPMVLSIKAPDGTSVEKTLQADSAYVEVVLGHDPWWKSPLAIAGGVGVLAVAVGLVAWSRRRKPGA